MRIFLTPALAVLTLTACGGGAVDADADGDGNVTAAEMEEAVAASGEDIRPEPGLYETTMEVIEVDMPGAPEEMKNMMSAAMGTTVELCVTPEMAEKGFEDSLKEGQNGDCTVSNFKLDGGDIDMAMSCKTDESGGMMDMTMSGKVTPTTSDMEMSMSGSVPELGDLSMKMAYKQKRIGECE